MRSFTEVIRALWNVGSGCRGFIILVTVPMFLAFILVHAYYLVKNCSQTSTIKREVEK